VKRGQEIAAVGNSGLSTGPHLHYEIHINGKVVDPLTYVMPDAIPD
jgi:murein DD-endopeptidase